MNGRQARITMERVIERKKVFGNPEVSHAFILTGLTPEELSMMKAVASGRCYVSRRRGRPQFLCVGRTPLLFGEGNANMRVTCATRTIGDHRPAIIGRFWSEDAQTQGVVRFINITDQEADKMRLVRKGKMYVTIREGRLEFLRVHRYPDNFLSEEKKRSVRVCVIRFGDELNPFGRRVT